jgi:nicotinamide-nucleotide amidase
MISSTNLETLAAELLETCRDQKLRIATIESCTGGLLAAVLTSIPGSSDVFERGFITYSNESKTELVGVDPDLILHHGAVSLPVAEAMAVGGLARSNADLCVSITGIAGPTGGTPTKPVGLVHMAAIRRGETVIHQGYRFEDCGRSAIRHTCVVEALLLLRHVAH